MVCVLQTACPSYWILIRCSPWAVWSASSVDWVVLLLSWWSIFSQSVVMAILQRERLLLNHQIHVSSISPPCTRKRRHWLTQKQKHVLQWGSAYSMKEKKDCYYSILIFFRHVSCLAWRYCITVLHHRNYTKLYPVKEFSLFPHQSLAVRHASMANTHVHVRVHVCVHVSSHLHVPGAPAHPPTHRSICTHGKIQEDM